MYSSIWSLFLFAVTDVVATVSDVFEDQRLVNRQSNASSLNATLEEILEDIEEAATSSNPCGVCQTTILPILHSIAQLGVEVMAEALVEFCITTDMASPDVCESLQPMEAPAFVYAVTSMQFPSRTAQIFCFTVFGLCPYPPVAPLAFNFTKPRPLKHQPSGYIREPLKVVHISDVHVDQNYTVGASFNCSEPLCCHAYTPPEAPGNTSFPAGPFGNHNCDLPVSLEESMYNAIKEIVPERAFSIFTGDISSTDWLATPEVVVFDTNDTFSRMNGLGVVYSAVGNHDSSPVNQFPPEQVVQQTNTSIQYAYDAFAEGLSQSIGSAAGMKFDTNSGSYSIIHPNSNLKIISFNTIFGMKENFWVYETTMEQDPSGVFEFIVQELDEAEECGQRVWILGHIAPGLDDMLYDFSASFDAIVQRYHGTIAAMFWGHVHRDQFEISYSNYSDQIAENAIAAGFIAPSVTPTSGYPSFRVYSVDPVTYDVLDYTSYYTNMSAPGFQVRPQWQSLYSFKEAYGSQMNPPYIAPNLPISPAFLNNVTDLFANDDNVFQEYNSRKFRGFDVTPCTGVCKTNELCQLRSAQAQFACYTPESIGVSKKRTLIQHIRDGGECEGSRALPILRSFGLDQTALKAAARKYLNRS